MADVRLFESSEDEELQYIFILKIIFAHCLHYRINYLEVLDEIEFFTPVSVKEKHSPKFVR